MGVGIFNALVLRLHHSSMLRVFSLGSHFIHILISSLAALFYMCRMDLRTGMIVGILFLFLVIAIVIPCTFSDVVVPMYSAGRNGKALDLKMLLKRIMAESILQNLSMHIPAGQIFVLLGPSGCGKTTLLRLIGGFEKVDSGKIFLGERDITDLTDTEKRPINMYFQNYALFPHLKVFENVAYSLMLQKVPRESIKERVSKILKTVRLEKHAFKRSPSAFGGHTKRVALARAIVK